MGPVVMKDGAITIISILNIVREKVDAHAVLQVPALYSDVFLIKSIINF